MLASLLSAAVLAATPHLLYVGDWTGQRQIDAVDPAHPGHVGVFMPGETGVEFFAPLASPNGRHVVFRSGPPGAAASEYDGALWVARTDGTGRRLLSSRSFIRSIAWSHDSRRVAWVAYEGNTAALHVALAEGRGDRIVGRSSTRSQPEVVWSADSRHVWARAFPAQVVESPDGTHLAMTSNLTTSIADSPTGDAPKWTVDGWSPVWSPDSRRLAYELKGGVAMLDIRTGRSTLLTHDLGHHLAWSPDGTSVAYVCCSEPFVNALYPNDVRVVTMTGHVRVVVPAGARNAGLVTGLAWPAAAERAYRRPAPASGVYLGGRVGALAADGHRVALGVCGLVETWSPGENASVVPGGKPCTATTLPSVVERIALSADRIVYVTEAGGNSQDWDVWLATAGGPPALVQHQHDTCCRGETTAAGGGGVLVYLERRDPPPTNEPFFDRTATWVVRPPGGEPLAALQQALAPSVGLDVSAGRIAVVHETGVDVIEAANGSHVVSIPLVPDPERRRSGGRPADVQLGAGDVVVHVGNRVDDDDLATGAVRHEWPLAANARLLDVARNRVAYTLDGALHVLRLTDGTDRTVSSGLYAAFDDDGLAYAVETRVAVLPWSALP